MFENTCAMVVILIATRGRYRYQKRIKWEAAEPVCKMYGIPCRNGTVETCMGYHRVAVDNALVQDQIHLTEKGGELLAKNYWKKLKNLYPYE